MNSFTDSDSDFWKKIEELKQKIMSMMEGKMEFRMILTDPLSHSFLQNPFGAEEDPQVTTLVRPRNEEENDFLGFADMQV